MIIVLFVGHSNDLWPRPLHVKHCIALVLFLGSFGEEDLDVSLGLKLVEVDEGRLEEVASSLELDGPPLVGGVLDGA